jgi:hypothetical protein
VTALGMHANPRLQRTRSGGLRPPTRAAEPERSASRMGTQSPIENLPVLCSWRRQPLVPTPVSHRPLRCVGHHRPAHARARAVDTPCSAYACSSRHLALGAHCRFTEARGSVLRQTSVVKAMLVSVTSSMSAHTAFAVLPWARAVPAATPNHQLQRTRSGGLRPPPQSAELRR